ncbi:hypothetical protein BDZ91DRAFT_735831 [Kalaharituber pfeilii]|nr:hypothetical protein BDZ91DRAFT_735831 [Kalaharituber pfeilii]
MKGDINTIKYQVGILLTAIVGTGGMLLGFFTKDLFERKLQISMMGTRFGAIQAAR